MGERPAMWLLDPVIYTVTIAGALAGAALAMGLATWVVLVAVNVFLPQGNPFRQDWGTLMLMPWHDFIKPVAWFLWTVTTDAMAAQRRFATWALGTLRRMVRG